MFFFVKILTNRKLSKDFFFLQICKFMFRLCLGGRGLTDLLGEDYYDYYDDYGSGLLSRIRNAVRLVNILHLVLIVNKSKKYLLWIFSLSKIIFT